MTIYDDENGADELEAIHHRRLEADLKIAAMNASADAWHAWRDQGYCNHGSALGASNDLAKERGLKPGQVMCDPRYGCGTVFDSDDEYMDACGNPWNNPIPLPGKAPAPAPGAPTPTPAETPVQGDAKNATTEADADIVIRHTHEDGTVVEGSSKGDGIWEALKKLGWTYRRTPGIFIRGSRLKNADRWKINKAADAVRALNLTVAVVIEENLSFAEREEARAEAADDRAERYADRSTNAAASSKAAYDRSSQIAERFHMGQPIIVGHYSEKGARRDQERMHNSMRKSINEDKRATYWAERAGAAEHYEAYRNNPGRTLRRIDKLEASLRKVRREWTGIELERRAGELEEEIAYWKGIIAKAEADGFKVWGRADFAKGDFVRSRGTWSEVLRVNAKSVTIPHIHAAHQGGVAGIIRDGSRVVTKASAAGAPMGTYTWTTPYDEVSGRMSAEEMRAALAGDPAPTPGHTDHTTRAPAPHGGVTPDGPSVTLDNADEIAALVSGDIRAAITIRKPGKRVKTLKTLRTHHGTYLHLPAPCTPGFTLEQVLRAALDKATKDRKKAKGAKKANG
ncbi:DUF3560 domain-containing protein [Streptomyces hydrogenans]|uniref:DUF3560 domain-containing protein n=1 Tax=Streptomyces hydrogenans TaxID=1873719 RepID=UPI00381A9F2B